MVSSPASEMSNGWRPYWGINFASTRHKTPFYSRCFSELIDSKVTMSSASMKATCQGLGNKCSPEDCSAGFLSKSLLSVEQRDSQLQMLLSWSRQQHWCQTIAVQQIERPQWWPPWSSTAPPQKLALLTVGRLTPPLVHLPQTIPIIL